MKLSRFGEKYTAQSGIADLMDDLGNARLINPDMVSMGGGNPARIPAVEAIFRERLGELMEDPERFHAIFGRYQSPQGEDTLLRRFATFLNAEYGWQLSEKNLAITNGGQAAFYLLANMLAGRHGDGSLKKIQLPMTPEYLGYTDTGLEQDFFIANKPSLEILDQHSFKYHVDFDNLKIAHDSAALCVSRPTNPTGNVLTDAEIGQLDQLAREQGIPLIIDNAYGLPFPNIVFVDATPHWNDNTILLLSLSKLGLPGLRSGLIVANEETISAFSAANAIANLASGNVGPYLLDRLLKDREVLNIGTELVKPWYRDKALRTVDWLGEALGDLPYYVHKPEGAIFLWLWCRDLPVDTRELYQRLKQRGLLVVPGNDSFPGLDQDWDHARQCIRLSYAQDDEQVKKGIGLLAAELKLLYGGESRNL